MSSSKKSLWQATIGVAGGAFLIIYIFGMFLAIPYFNYEFARKNGFVSWMLLGEIIPTTQGLIWPYYAYEHYSVVTAANTSETDNTSSKTIIEIKKVRLINDYADQAPHLPMDKYKNLDDFLRDCHNLSAVLDSAHKIDAVGQTIDVEVLNTVFPEFGSKYKEEFIKWNHLFISACETGSKEIFMQTKIPYEEWDIWYSANSTAIENAFAAVSH